MPIYMKNPQIKPDLRVSGCQFRAWHYLANFSFCQKAHWVSFMVKSVISV
jgi:hypothetical protein